MNEGKLISRLIVLFTLIIGGFLYAANNPHKSFSLDKFGEDAQYSQQQVLDLTKSVIQNREILNNVSEQIKALTTSIERLNSDYKLSTETLRDEIIDTTNLLGAHKIRLDSQQEAISIVANMSEINKTRNDTQELSLEAASDLIEKLVNNDSSLRTKLNIDTEAQNAVVTNSQLDTDY